MLWPLLALLLVSSACASGEGQSLVPTQAVHLFSTVAPPGKSCAPTSDIPTAGLNLTAEERDMLQYICWEPEGGPLGLGERRGIPPGVTCTTKEWCDGDVCSTVCAAGTVAVEPWLHNAVKVQARLARALPFCFATLLGTHNSAITLADGYGNLDPYFQQFFKYIKWAVSDFSDALLRTNDQWLSLTDQLNLGVRGLEIDTHWVGGALRIAHCGGFHVEPLNQLIRAINLVAKLLHRHVRWDTETFGCVPSLSSIPAMEQRLMVEGLAEVKAWLDAPGNEDEFLVIYFDDQPDLMSWEVEEELQNDVRSVFSPEHIFSMDDLAAYQAAHGPGAWPAAAEMVAAGKRVLFVSGADYGEAMHPLIFSRSDTVCGWTEPDLDRVEGLPLCVINSRDEASRDGSTQPQPLFSGSLVRVQTCELEYGPLNCDFVFRGSNEPFLDEATMPAVLGCGLNMPSPDLLTPSKAAAAIWTWAPGHPYEAIPDTGLGSAGAAAARRAEAKGAAAGGGEGRLAVEEEANCAVISASDGRWRAVPCSQALPTACRAAVTNSVAAGGAGRIGALPSSQWVLPPAGAAKGVCPGSSKWDVPRHPADNYHLATLLREAGVEAAWLPVSGPDWEVPDLAGGGSNAATTA